MVCGIQDTPTRQEFIKILKVLKKSIFDETDGTYFSRDIQTAAIWDGIITACLYLGRPRTSDFSRCDYRAAQMKHTAVHGSARTSDYLIVAIKKSQRVPYKGRRDCRLTTACRNKTPRNKWVRADGRLSPLYLCVKPGPSKAIPLR